MTDLVSDIANCSLTAWPMFTHMYESNRSFSELNKEGIVFRPSSPFFHSRQ